MHRSLLLGIWPALVACSSAHAREPGDPLGMFHVVAVQGESTCGAGAMGAPPIWEFDVKLVRDADVFYWVNGSEYIAGALGTDGVSFAVSSRREFDMTDEWALTPCVVTRLDTARGKLDDPDDVEAFAGTLVYSYEAGIDHDCRALVGVKGGFRQLPCEITFDIEASLAADSRQ